MLYRRIFQILLCVVSLTIASGDLEAKDINDFTSFTGKLKKDKPVGEGSLTIRSSRGPSIIITGTFNTLPDGRTQAVGSLEAPEKRSNILKGTYTFDSQDINSITIEKGYIFEMNGVVMEGDNNNRLSVGKVLGQSEREEKIDFTPAHTINSSNALTPFYVEFPNMKIQQGFTITGSGSLGVLDYITLSSKENSEYVKYKGDGSKFVPVEAHEGENWIKFSTKFPYEATSFFKKEGNKSLSGEFIEKKRSDDPNIFKGIFVNGGNKVEGEYILPVSGNKNGFRPRDVADFDKIPLNPEFLTVTKSDKAVKNHRKITLEGGGTLVNHFLPEDFLNIDSLTIVGIMYRSDFKLINALTNLEYLDLSATYITDSPEEKRKRKEEDEFAEFFLGFMKNENERRAQNNTTTPEQYENVKFFLQMMENSKDVNPKTDPCFVPAIKKLPALKTVILPVVATKIEDEAFTYCPNLTTVIFPEILQSIGKGCFYDCKKLTGIVFPKTLQRLSTRFYDCASLTKFDLSQCKFQDREISLSFGGCTSMKYVAYPANTVDATFRIMENREYELFLPETLKKLFVGFSQGGNNYRKGTVILHFSSPEPPELDLGYKNNRENPDNKKPLCSKIYVPKGSRTAYYLKYGDGFEYIEE